MQGENYSNNGGGLVKWSMPPIHPEGRKFALIAGGVTLFFALIGWELLAWPMVAITAWVLAFFRDPVRITPIGDNFILAPADGLITLISQVPPPPELAGDEALGDKPLVRISIFMSVFDVHINRAPIGGTVRRVVYISGRFLNADLDKASEDNERQHIMVEREDGVRIGFTQIAGLVARRIVAYVKEGDTLAAGQRVGMIRFGSRVDVYLPAGTAPRVIQGQKAVAGETILAVHGEAEEMTGIGQ